MQKRHMFTQIAVCFSLLLVVALTNLSAGGGEVKMKGEVLDLACFVGGNSGGGHAACANKCIQSGQPAGFQSVAGDVYLLMGKALTQKLENLVGIPVNVTGTVKERDGFKALQVSSVAKAAH